MTRKVKKKWRNRKANKKKMIKKMAIKKKLQLNKLPKPMKSRKVNRSRTQLK